LFAKIPEYKTKLTDIYKFIDDLNSDPILENYENKILSIDQSIKKLDRFDEKIEEFKQTTKYFSTYLEIDKEIEKALEFHN